MSLSTRLYIGLVIAAGLAVFTISAAGWHTSNTSQFVTFIVLACISGVLKIRLPGVTGTQSGGFVIVLLAVAQLNPREAVAVGTISALVQYAYHSRTRLRLVQAAFNTCNVAIAALTAGLVFHSDLLLWIGLQHPLRLIVASLVYFAANCLIVAVVISLTEHKPLNRIFREYYLWSLPFYPAAAIVAECMTQLDRHFGWQTAVLVVPALYAVYSVWAVFADRVEAERKRQEQARIHAEEMSELHVRTIHALAMAIEARDRTTHDHLQRVQIYAVELGRCMGLAGTELEALRTAAVLHDIGKLGVPEHIISKPGRLTPDEFIKVQAHPVIGADILERVNFPYAVVPIVRSHHERFDGTGYPAGLKGSEIPIGARILSVVDCFDALASDRQYRKAMSVDQALGIVKKSAGRDFDPEVVNLLAERYQELEAMVRTSTAAIPPMMTRQEIRNAVPAAGFQRAIVAGGSNYDFSLLVRAASTSLAPSAGTLGLVDALASADAELRDELHYEYMAVFLREEMDIRLSYLTREAPGPEAIAAVGQGLSGWVVEEGRPILNGNGRLDALVQTATGRSDLVSASSVPIQMGDRTAGALTIYSSKQDSFSARDLQVLWSIGSQIGACLITAASERQLRPSEPKTVLVSAGG